MIGFGIVLVADVGYREFQGTGQLLANPVKGIEPRAAAGVLAVHLPDHYLGIGEDV